MDGTNIIDFPSHRTQEGREQQVKTLVARAQKYAEDTGLLPKPDTLTDREKYAAAQRQQHLTNRARQLLKEKLAQRETENREAEERRRAWQETDYSNGFVDGVSQFRKRGVGGQFHSPLFA